MASKIDVSVSGLPLGQVAAKFDRLLARDVLVPASRVRKTVRLRLKGVSVSAAIGLWACAPRRGGREVAAVQAARGTLALDAADSETLRR